LFSLSPRPRAFLRPAHPALPQPGATSIAAILIGAPMPSTTGTPSSPARHCGFISTGHWVIPCARMTSAPSSSISARAAAGNSAGSVSKLKDSLFVHDWRSVFSSPEAASCQAPVAESSVTLPPACSWSRTCRNSNIRLQTRTCTIALGAQNAARKCILRGSSRVTRDSISGPSNARAASTRKAFSSKTCKAVSVRFRPNRNRPRSVAPSRPHRGCEPSFGQRTRLCRSPSATSMAAILIGAPMPSTTGTPSSVASQCGPGGAEAAPHRGPWFETPRCARLLTMRAARAKIIVQRQ
jgi:hypothetical protein